MALQQIIPGTGAAGLASLLQNEREVFLVCDRALIGKKGPFCTPVGEEPGMPVGAALKRALGERLVGEFMLEASEEVKGIETVMEIERAMMEAGVSRGGLVLSIGGGITTDIGGFAASIYKRGIRFANVPTTLLAMVDAAIGGKTGVNLDGYKNMVGVIRQPEFVYIDESFLRTLPEREIRCGLAELLKTFLLADAALFEDAVAALPEVLPEHILAAGRIKEQIVSEDPYEHGRRTILNLGHTFAHAIEKLSSESIPHGEAVAIGIVLACKLSDKLGVSEDGALEARVRSAFLKAGLPVESPYSVRELSAAMAKDKKSTGAGAVTFVLLAAPGRPVLRSLALGDLS